MSDKITISQALKKIADYVNRGEVPDLPHEIDERIRLHIIANTEIQRLEAKYLNQRKKNVDSSGLNNSVSCPLCGPLVASHKTEKLLNTLAADLYETEAIEYLESIIEKKDLL